MTKIAIIKIIINKEPRTCLRSATDFWMSGSARLMQFSSVLEIELSMLGALCRLSALEALISLRFAALLLLPPSAAVYPPLCLHASGKRGGYKESGG